MKKKVNPPSHSSTWFKIGLITSPFFLLIAFMLVLARVKPDPSIARAKSARIEEVGRVVSAAGGTLEETSAGSLIIVLPNDTAMAASAAQARELALMAHNRTGSVVRVETPAGQTLAKVP